MKRKLTHIVGIITMLIGSISSNVFAQTTAPGPYYATPSWDQQLPASTRFIVLANWVDANSPRGAQRCWTGRPGWCGNDLRRRQQ
jgi:hypothetical protein